MSWFKREVAPEVESPGLSKEDFDRLRCAHCGGIHTRACPRVKLLEFSPAGAIIKVEFWEYGLWPADAIQWEEDVVAYGDGQ